jgi:hypothetical protein
MNQAPTNKSNPSISKGVDLMNQAPTAFILVELFPHSYVLVSEIRDRITNHGK